MLKIMDPEVFRIGLVVITRKYSVIKLHFVHVAWNLMMTLNGQHYRLPNDQFDYVAVSYPDDAEEEEGVTWPGCEFNIDSTRYAFDDLELLVFKIIHKRVILLLPNNFQDFITGIIIPSFKDQCLTGNQFAVVVLLSENDLYNIFDTTFVPSNGGQPLLNKYHPSMPHDTTHYGNYIVAHPNNSWHSEEEIFGKYFSINSHFCELWTAYMRRNGSPPKCVLLYTWNLPCSRCTDVIIRSLNDNMYRCTSVIVAHTIYWRSESEEEHRENKEKLKKENIAVVQVPYPEYLSPA